MLTAGAWGSGTGSVTSSLGEIACGTAGYSCVATYPVGRVVTLMATPDPGSEFTGWDDNGMCVEWVPVCTVTMNVAHTVMANFSEVSALP